MLLKVSRVCVFGQKCDLNYDLKYYYYCYYTGNFRVTIFIISWSYTEKKISRMPSQKSIWLQLKKNSWISFSSVGLIFFSAWCRISNFRSLEAMARLVLYFYFSELHSPPVSTLYFFFLLCVLILFHLFTFCEPLRQIVLYYRALHIFYVVYIHDSCAHWSERKTLWKISRWLAMIRR
jgi:hypothetical protein